MSFRKNTDPVLHGVFYTFQFKYSWEKMYFYDITVVIVTYNNRGEITTCLTSLAHACRGLRVQLIIVDNASQDGTIKQVQKSLSGFSKIEIVNNGVNFGFTKAVNQGLHQSLGKFVLLLNPDTELEANTVSILINHLNERPDVGIAAPQLVFPDGTIQPSCRRFPQHRDVLFEFLGLGRFFPRSRIFNGWKMGDFDHQHTQEVDQPQGAVLFVRSSAYEQVGKLDPRFTMFFSDVDWCQRFKLKRWKILFCADSRAIHRKGASVNNNRSRMIIQSHRDFIAYFRKYFSGPIQSFLNNAIELLLLVGTFPRLFFSEIKKLF